MPTATEAQRTYGLTSHQHGLGQLRSEKVALHPWDDFYNETVGSMDVPPGT